MENKNIEKELLDCEKRFWQALQDNDVDTALSMTDDPCIVVGPQGVGLVDKGQFEDMMKNAPYQLKKFEFRKDAQVRQISDDVAIIAYTASEEILVGGKTERLEIADSSTWIKRDGKWVCSLHTEALLGDPYGRDRKAS